MELNLESVKESVKIDAIQPWLDRKLFSFGESPITVESIIVLLAIIVTTVFISKGVQWLVGRGLKRKGVKKDGSIAVAKQLVHYLVLLIGVSVGLDAIGINLGALFAAGAIFAVGIGFAMQNIVQNFVSGVILLLEQSIKPGDVLEVNGTVVQVQDLRIRTAIVRTRDDEELIVPNSLLVQSSVKNYTFADSLYRQRTVVGVSYDSDMKLVRQVLEDCAKKFSSRISAKDPIVFMTEFASSSVNFEIGIWIDNPWRARFVLSQLNEDIWFALKDAGITIAYPQIDVHVKEMRAPVPT